MHSAPLASPAQAPSFQKVDPAGSSAVDVLALWNRFRQALVADLGTQTATRRLRRAPQEPPRAMRYFLVRGIPAGWQFRTLAEADVADLGDAFEPRPADCATDALPGTPEKLAVLGRRLAQGEALFHADDPRRDPPREALRSLARLLEGACHDPDRADLQRRFEEADRFRC